MLRLSRLAAEGDTARRSCECVASMLQRDGGDLVSDRVTTLMRGDGQIEHLRLASGDVVRAGQYVFACGPWLWKIFANWLQPRMRTSMGHVFYVGTPVGNARFPHPNMPSHNFPGITGWPALSVDNRGFRTRVGGGPHGVVDRGAGDEALDQVPGDGGGLNQPFDPG